MVAAAVRSAAVAIVLGWLAVSNPERGPALAWVLGTAAFFLVTGLAQLWLYGRGRTLRLAAYVFILVDARALATVLPAQSLHRSATSSQIPLRYETFIYFFLLLMQAAFSFRPSLLVWIGLCGVAAWTMA